MLPIFQGVQMIRVDRFFQLIFTLSVQSLSLSPRSSSLTSGLSGRSLNLGLFFSLPTPPPLYRMLVDHKAIPSVKSVGCTKAL